METLHFWTTGKDFSRMVRNFVKEGAFHTAYNILKDGGMSPRMIKEFFEGKWKFEGSTKNGGALEVVLSNKLFSDFDFYYALKTCLQETGYDVWEFVRVVKRLDKEDVKYKNVVALLQVFNQEEICAKVWRLALEELKYPIHTQAPIERSMDGAIIRNGAWIECGYQGHDELYTYLYGLGLADAPDWTDDTWTIHVSAGLTSGALGYDYPLKPSSKGAFMTKEQTKMLFDMKDNIRGEYGFGEDKLLESLRQSFVDLYEKGSKFGNLMFLKELYPSYKYPAISLSPLDGIPQCIRTSPKYSIPGLLNSKFDLNENSVSELQAEWEKYKDVVSRNEFNYFYQEYIEGKNGVSLYSKDKSSDHVGQFEYQMSDKRGDVVKGVVSTELLSPTNYDKLRKLSSELFPYFGQPVQLEFVVDDQDILYIVQFRLMKNAPSNNYSTTPEDVLFKGESFSAGTVETDADDILIVDSEADSEALLGKKALLVRETPKFSHILALSAALGIPSMCGVGDVKLEGRIIINTNNQKGYAQKVDNK